MKRPINHYLQIALLSCLLPSMALAQAAPQQAPAAPVVVEKAQRDTFSATLWVSGTVISKNDARIAAETDGRITWVADVGTRIRQGKAIASIDAADLRLDLADSEAQLNSLKSQLKFLKSSFERLQRLAVKNNASATQIDEAQSNLDMARQGIKRAEISIAQIKRRIS